MKNILALLLVLTVLMVPTAVMAQDTMDLNPDQPADSSLNQGPNNKTVATVNGEEISAQQLARQANINQVLQQLNQVDPQLTQILASSEAGNKVLDQLQKAKLDSLIDNILLEQKAEEIGITLSQSEKDEIYQKQKQAIIGQNQISEEDFVSVLKQQGFETEAAYKKEFTKNPQIKINKLVEEEVIAEIEITEEEMQQAYDQNKEALAQAGQDSSFEDLKPRLKQMLKQQKQGQAINQYLKSLREEAEIEKNL